MRLQKPYQVTKERGKMRSAYLFALLTIIVAFAQEPERRPGEVSSTSQTGPRQILDKQIAAQFAPVFYQGLGEAPRSDLIANFDFDGDWKGDNNWWNLDNRAYPLRAYVYYSVAETATHYFVHYAVFHPRDYKGGLAKSALVEVLIGEGLRRAGKDPTGGLANDVALSHENDLEGCLVVAEKQGRDLSKAVVRFVETMAHNRFLKYCPREDRPGICESIEMKEQRPLIFIEPKGHGPARYTGSRQQLKGAIKGVMVYSYSGQAEDGDKALSRAGGKTAGYDLIPIYDTLWSRAQQGENETYGEAFDYQIGSFLKLQNDKAAVKPEQKLGVLGSAFRGTVGFKNKSRPPWGWFDDSEKDRPRGEWFFDPAAVIARHFGLGEGFSIAYVYNLYFKIGL
jgi:hypothetical protein